MVEYTLFNLKTCLYFQLKLFVHYMICMALQSNSAKQSYLTLKTVDI